MVVIYEEVTEETYAAAFAAKCTATPTSRGVILNGACPRCADPMTFPHVSTVFKTASVLGQTSAADPGDVQMLCTCSESHPGRPEGEDGCGAYWNIRLATAP